MSAARPGTVYLIGAGPGSDELVTTRALELVRSADVVLADRYVPSELREQVRSSAELIDVGRSAEASPMSQDEINDRLVSEALAGRRVVRLKRGDPYLLGRGSEEAMRCRAAQVPFEVVPGVTSALAACTAAGIPVTHRDLSRCVTVVSAAPGPDGQDGPDYTWLAASTGTIVLLHALRRIEHVAASLVTSGMDPHRPVAVISRATTSEQRVVSGTLSTIAALVDAAKLSAPAIVVVGEVVELREHLDWFEQRPLFGTRVAVTRPRSQSRALVQQLTALGAQVVTVPAIRTERVDPAQLDATIDRLAQISTVVFTSRAGVDALFARLDERGLDARVLGNVAHVAAVGPATAAACRERGIVADVVPPVGSRTALGLLAVLSTMPLFGTTCAIFRAEVGDDRLPDGLARLNVEVLLTPVYRTCAEPATSEQVDALLGCDVVTFTAPSTVDSVLAMLPHGATLPPCVTIGPVTSDAARAAGLRVLQEAADPSTDTLVETVVASMARAPRPAER